MNENTKMGRGVKGGLRSATRWPALWPAGLLAAGLLALGASSAWALDPVATNNSGTFTVRITPNVDLGVTVDTTGSAWAGGANLDTSMDLSAEKILGTGVKLTVAGNFQNQEFQLGGANAAVWTLDVDETLAQDQMQLHGMIGADQTAAPATALFNGALNLITTTAKRAGQVQADEAGNLNHEYEFSTAQAPEYADVDGMAVAAARRLWLRAKTPNTSSTDAQQAFVVTVTAVTGVGL